MLESIINLTVFYIGLLYACHFTGYYSYREEKSSWRLQASVVEGHTNKKMEKYLHKHGYICDKQKIVKERRGSIF